MKLSLINKRIKQKWVKPTNLKIGDIIRFLMPIGGYRYCKIICVETDFIHGNFYDDLNKPNTNTYGGIYKTTVAEVLR